MAGVATYYKGAASDATSGWADLWAAAPVAGPTGPTGATGAPDPAPPPAGDDEGVTEPSGPAGPVVVETTEAPDMSWTKAEILAWLRANGAEIADDKKAGANLTKAELLELVEDVLTAP